jgi:hypothetical protein
VRRLELSGPSSTIGSSNGSTMASDDGGRRRLEERIQVCQPRHRIRVGEREAKGELNAVAHWIALDAVLESEPEIRVALHGAGLRRWQWNPAPTWLRWQVAIHRSHVVLK